VFKYSKELAAGAEIFKAVGVTLFPENAILKRLIKYTEELHVEVESLDKKLADVDSNEGTDKLAKYCADGKFYEAQQLYRTLYSRYISGKKYPEAGSLALSGALQMFQHGQANSGADLASLLIDSYSKAEAKVADDRIQTVVNLFAAFPKNSEDVRQAFLKQAIVWSEKFGSNPYGNPALHYTAAKYYADKMDFANAARHFVRADSPTQHAAMLLVWCKRGLKSERDLFIARTVLQYLCIENLAGANTVMEKFMAGHGTPIDSPLIHFVQFLLKTCERAAAPLFQMLRAKYAKSIERDPNFDLYLNKIGEVFFEIKAPQSMMSIMTSLL